MNTPAVIRSSVTGIAARKVKGIEGNDEGMIVTPLMDKVPQDQAGIDALKRTVASNPAYEDLLVSKDQKTTLIVADFKDTGKGMKLIDQDIRAAIDPERDTTVDIALGGQTIALAQLERFSERMAFLLPLAILIIGLIHFEAFRTFQALLLPLVTAIIAVVWSLSFLAISKLPMDVFNATTPILILAIAAGHAVQVLKRYYEEFSKLKEISPERDPRELNREAIVNRYRCGLRDLSCVSLKRRNSIEPTRIRSRASRLHVRGQGDDFREYGSCRWVRSPRHIVGFLCSCMDGATDRPRDAGERVFDLDCVCLSYFDTAPQIHLQRQD